MFCIYTNRFHILRIISITRGVQRIMKFEDYVEERKKLFENQPFNKETTNLLWASNSLCGESGEFANVVKKVYRDKGGDQNKLMYDLKDELGDVMWYWLFVCQILKVDPHEILAMNIGKLKKRYYNFG